MLLKSYDIPENPKIVHKWMGYECIYYIYGLIIVYWDVLYTCALELNETWQFTVDFTSVAIMIKSMVIEFFVFFFLVQLYFS